MREVERVADRVAIMHRGAILAEGTRQELIDRYEQPDLEELFFDLISRQDRDPEQERDAGEAGTNSAQEVA
jgi:sodium transport system ATP-binding protein